MGSHPATARQPLQHQTDSLPLCTATLAALCATPVLTAGAAFSRAPVQAAAAHQVGQMGPVKVTPMKLRSGPKLQSPALPSLWLWSGGRCRPVELHGGESRQWARCEEQRGSAGGRRGASSPPSPPPPRRPQRAQRAQHALPAAPSMPIMPSPLSLPPSPLPTCGCSSRR